MLPQAKFGLPTDTYKILIKNPVGTSHFSQCWGTSDWLCWMLASFRALVLPSFDPNWVGLLAESQVQPNLQKVRARVQSCQMTSLQITKESQRSETILMLWGHLVILGRASLRPFQLQLHQRLYFVSPLWRAVGPSLCYHFHLFGILPSHSSWRDWHEGKGRVTHQHLSHVNVCLSCWSTFRSGRSPCPLSVPGACAELEVISEISEQNFALYKQ